MANIERLVERFAGYTDIPRDTLRDLIGAIAHEGWREETGRADTVRTPDKLLNETCELASTSLRKLQEVAGQREMIAIINELDETNTVSAEDTKRMANVLLDIMRDLAETFCQCRNYQTVVDRNLREFATRWTMERRGEPKTSTAPVSSPSPPTMPHVIKFQYAISEEVGMYRVVIRQDAVSVERLAGYDGMGAETWAAIEGKERALVLAELAVRKAYGLLPPLPNAIPVYYGEATDALRTVHFVND